MISTTLLTLLALGSAHAAPWPVVVAEELGQAPARVSLYAPAPDKTLTSMDDLQRAFAMQGQAERDDALGGLWHLGHDGVHLVAFDDGGAHYHDTFVMDLDQAIEPWSEQRLREESVAVLRDLDLIAQGPAHLELSGIGFVEHFVIEDGQEKDARVSQQGTNWLQVIDGLPAFGPGAETELLFGEGGAIASFSHAQRPLESLGSVPVLSPRQAVFGFLADADETGQWNHYKAAVGEVEVVELHAAELGYWVPGRGESVGAPYEPVYAITGTIHGTDPMGEPAAIDLLWYQPALRGPARLAR
jgi:hypothetical protein